MTNGHGRLSVCHILALLTAMTLTARAQEPSGGDVHIVPRKAPELPSSNRSDSSVRPPGSSIIKDVDLVLVPVTITDEANRPVIGMHKTDFRVYEAGKPQEIRYFSSEDAPISLAVIVDVSSSMADKFERSREAVARFLSTANPQDEFVIITFADKPRALGELTQSVETVRSQMVYLAPKGNTALIDAIYLGISKLKQARNERRALLVISDGGDNHSRYSLRELETLAQEADVQIYAIGIYDYTFRTIEEQYGPALLNRITALTGGRTVAADAVNLEIAAAQIGILLRNQYLIGYKPTNVPHDGKWHKIKIKVALPNKPSRLLLSARQGYYASPR
jgi:Ca-activated chloride channel homolog